MGSKSKKYYQSRSMGISGQMCSPGRVFSMGWLRATLKEAKVGMPYHPTDNRTFHKYESMIGFDKMLSLTWLPNDEL